METDRRFWSRRALKITPYQAGEQPKEPDIIKLNTNENPYPPAPGAGEAIRNFHADTLRLYPKPDSDVLRQSAARRHGLKEDWVFCGNGSDDVLAIAFQALFDGPLAVPDVTYSFYPVWADLFGIPLETIPLNEDFTLPVQAFCGKQNVILPNPNAPTSLAISRGEVEEIVKSAWGAVVIDEAYVEFGAETAVPFLEKYPNLLIVRTLSKSHSLAGLRVGYALGQPSLIDALNCIKDSYNSYPVDAIAQAAAAAALEDENYTQNILELIKYVRDYTVEELERLGFTVLPPKGNFVFCKHPDYTGEYLLGQLRRRGILVRRFGQEKIADFLRISIGTRAQMDALLVTLQDLLAGDKLGK